MAGMTIGKLAASGGVGVETIRYYQRRGLLQEPLRDEFYGGVRRYGASDVQRLRFIRAAQGAGFTLDQIAELLEFDATDDRARAQALATERIAALDAKIAELQEARTALSRLARDCASAEAGPCPILMAFDAGQQG